MKKAIIKIAVCLTAVLFMISCGNNANTSTNPTPTPKNLSVTYTFLNNGDDRIDVNTEANNNQVTVETGGIGYAITVSDNTSFKLPPIGFETTLYLYLQVREDEVGLYGFINREEKEMFLKSICRIGYSPFLS